MIKETYNNNKLWGIELDTTNCCGIEELHCLSQNPNNNLVQVNSISDKRAMIIFHDVVTRQRGVDLAKKIKLRKLGKVQCSKQVFNPNSNNIIQMWTWYPDFEALETYVEKLHNDPNS